MSVNHNERCPHGIPKAEGFVPCAFCRMSDLECQLSEAKAELKTLRREVREWLCATCNTVYPGPPQAGVKCVICPKCGGYTAPHGSASAVMLLKAETEAMRPVVEAAKRIHKIIGTAHNDEAEFTSWSNLDDALREYESRKQP